MLFSNRTELTASTCPKLSGEGRGGPWPRGGLTSACSRRAFLPLHHECDEFFFVFVPDASFKIHPFEIAMAVAVVVVVWVSVDVVAWCGASVVVVVVVFVGRGRVVFVVVAVACRVCRRVCLVGRRRRCRLRRGVVGFCCSEHSELFWSELFCLSPTLQVQIGWGYSSKWIILFVPHPSGWGC